MTEEIVNKICKEVFYTQPTEIIRNNVGLAGYVYTVQINNEEYVVKISDDKNLISGSTYWLNKVKDLDIPIPKVISENTSAAPYYFVMTFIPGKDLGLVYILLSKDEKKAIAKKLISYQKEIKKLPMATGFGSLNSYEDIENLFPTWEEVILNDIKRAEYGIKENKIFSTEYASKVRDLIPGFKDYFWRSSLFPGPHGNGSVKYAGRFGLCRISEKRNESESFSGKSAFAIYSHLLYYFHVRERSSF